VEAEGKAVLRFLNRTSDGLDTEKILRAEGVVPKNKRWFGRDRRKEMGGGFCEKKNKRPTKSQMGSMPVANDGSEGGPQRLKNPPVSATEKKSVLLSDQLA